MKNGDISCEKHIVGLVAEIFLFIKKESTSDFPDSLLEYQFRYRGIKSVFAFPTVNTVRGICRNIR